MLCVTWLSVEESDGGQREEKENTDRTGQCLLTYYYILASAVR